ncbi:MAG: hypothetical protein ABGX16_17190 [Pirellulales bacterium]
MHSNCYGILAIWHDLDPSRVLEFCEWHTREHMPERLSVPGFLLGCRYESVENPPLVFNYYVTESPATLTSLPYLKRLNNPTEWTTHIMPALCDVYRAVGQEVASTGSGQGGLIATLRFNIKANRHQHFQSWFVKHGLHEIVDNASINKIHLWQADTSASAIESIESSARGGNSVVHEWTVAIEGTDIQSVRAACEWLQLQQSFTESLHNTALVGFYRLMHRLDS